jgi:replicative DNA helicase
MSSTFKTDSVTLFNAELEELALVSLVKGEGLVRDVLFGHLREEHFFTSFGKEVFSRIKFLLKEKNLLPSEVSVIGDHTISENSKVVIKNSEFLLNETFLKTQHEVLTLTSQLDHWCRLRKLHQVHTLSGEALVNTNRDINSTISTLTNKLYEINTNSESFSSSITKLTDDSTLHLIKDKIFAKRTDQCIPTGFKQFDQANIGLPRGGLTVLAGQTGGGKSLMALTMVKHMALSGFKACLVSLEMNEIELLERRFSSVTGIPIALLRQSEKLTEQDKEAATFKFEEYQKSMKQAGGVEDYKCRLNDLTVEELLYGLKPYGYDVIVIDYLGLLKGVDGDDQWRRLSEAARFCKIFAEENNINIIALAQLSKDGEIRYSRGILEHANNSFSWVSDKRTKETGIIEVEQKKNRTGKTSNFFLEVDFTCMTMKDLSDNSKRDKFLGAAKESESVGFPQKKKPFFK